jgi:hypothetical protein
MPTLAMSDASEVTGALQIDPVGDDLKVSRIDTPPVPAKVIEFFALGDWSDVVLVEHSVSLNNPLAMVDLDLTVTSAASANPFPALATLDDKLRLDRLDGPHALTNT